jgi:hypothetical protein
MTTDDELRDFFAAFAMNSLLQQFREFDMSLDKADYNLKIAEGSYELADEMIKARKPKEPEVGIAAIKTRRKKDVQ